MRPQPPLRCQKRSSVPPYAFCGRVGTHVERQPDDGSIVVLCDWCAAPSSRPVAAALDVVLVEIVSRVTFAGISLERQTACHEALEQLRVAVQTAGGVMAMPSAVSRQVRYYPAGVPVWAPDGD